MVLGNVNKIAAGLRNQLRSAPLETTEVLVQDGRRLRLPTIEEMLRIKSFLDLHRPRQPKAAVTVGAFQIRNSPRAATTVIWFPKRTPLVPQRFGEGTNGVLLRQEPNQ
jgi:hypothetical protein